jgi:hypothetical protein
VSHSKERHEKICLNCNAELTGRYCQVCGQENIEPKESVWGLVSHFFYDITHFDGKFFSTTKYLITKPGFLPREYIKGRRASYLHPIRMYVFSSAIFFLIFFSLYNPKEFVRSNDNLKNTKAKIVPKTDSLQQLDAWRNALLKDVHNREDSAFLSASLDKLRDKIASGTKKGKVKVKDPAERKDSSDAANYRYKGVQGKAGDTAKIGETVKAKPADTVKADEDEDNDEDNEQDSLDKKNKVRTISSSKKNGRRIAWFQAAEEYKTVEAYDSAQKALPESERDGWWATRVAHRNIYLEEKARHSDDGLIGEIAEVFMHMLPYMLFISLPLYALFMKMLYARHKQYYYVDHGIFFIYLYVFTFIFLLLYFSVQKVHQKMDWGWLGWIEGLLLLSGVFYTYKAMRNFYGQSRGMTILKFMLLNLMATFALAFLFIIFFTLTIFRL